MLSRVEDTGAKRPCTLLRETLKRLPSTIARLAFLSEQRDVNTGIYRHSAVSSPCEKTEIDHVLRRLHEETFAEWLSCGLEEQKADLDLYFSGLDCPKADVVRSWLRIESYRALIPASASPEERRLFFADLSAILHLMARQLRCVPEESESGASGKQFLSAKDLSKWLGVSARTVRLWAEGDEIPAVKIGRQWRFERADVQEWIGKRGGH